MATLLAAPYNVDGGDSIWAKVISANVYGESALSLAGNNAYYVRGPDQPINLQEDISVRTATTDGLTWEDGPNTGGTEITGYTVKKRVSGVGEY